MKRRDASSHSLAVLIVEDDKDQRKMLRMALQARGHVVAVECERGDDPRFQARIDADVAVVDLGLPGRNGVEVIRDLRAHNKDMTIIVLSATAEDETISIALEIGAAAYIVKGARLAEIVDAVEHFANRRQVMAALANAR